MTRSIAVLLLVLAQAALAHAADPATAPDDQPPIKAGIDLGMTSAYIWRGFVERPPPDRAVRQLRQEPERGVVRESLYVGVTLSAK
jgi:hypothetical protein